jgi:hypothetical protein
MAELVAAKAVYERMLESGPHPSAYDRIYFAIPGKGLYVALKESGKVNAHPGSSLAQGSPVQMIVDGKWRTVGNVIDDGVVDIDNSLWEATVGFNSRQIGNLVRVWQEAVNTGMKRSAAIVEGLANKFVSEAAALPNPSSQPAAQKPAVCGPAGCKSAALLTAFTWAAPFSAGAFGASNVVGAKLGVLAGTMASWPVVAPAVLLPILLGTGFNVAQYMRRTHDLSIFYEICGVTVASDKPIRF